jgi:hypothetical protein
MTNNRYSFAIPPHVLREVFIYFTPSNQRARGGRAPDAPDSRVCKLQWVERTRVSQVTPESPGTPRAMIYSL